MAHREGIPNGRRPVRRTFRPGGWLVLAIAVAVLAPGLLGLRAAGLDLLGTRGLIAVYVLGEALGIGGVVFVGRSIAATARNATEAEQLLSTARRWILSGLAFVVGMGLIAFGAQFLPSAISS